MRLASLYDTMAGNAAEHYSAIAASRKNKMNLAIGIAVGSRYEFREYTGCAQNTRFTPLVLQRTNCHMPYPVDGAAGLVHGTVSFAVSSFLASVHARISRVTFSFFGLHATASISVSVVLQILLVQDGSSNWLKGLVLVGWYCIMAFGFFFSPVPATPHDQHLTPSR
jgi:Ca2+:H+ antiporter